MKHFLFTVALALVNSVNAAEVIVTKINPANGHAYSVIRGDDSQRGISWADANEHAKSMGGHLVVVNDEDESEWLTKSFPADAEKRLDYYYWIGLTDAESEGRFRWVNGEPVDYTNWYGAEPNNAGAGEDYVQIYNFPEGSYSWNDLPNRSIFSEDRKDAPISAIVEVPTPVQATNNNSERESLAGLYYEVNGAADPIRIVNVGVDRFEVHTPSWTGLGFWDRLRNCYEGVYRYRDPYGGGEVCEVVGFHRMKPLGNGRFKVTAMGSLNADLPVVPYEIKRVDEGAVESSNSEGSAVDCLHLLGDD